MRCTQCPVGDRWLGGVFPSRRTATVRAQPVVLVLLEVVTVESVDDRGVWQTRRPGGAGQRVLFEGGAEGIGRWLGGLR